jgi:hypothetical protein
VVVASGRAIPLGLRLVDLTPQPLDLQLFRLHLTVTGKGLSRIRAKLLDSLAQHVLMNVQVVRRLRHGYLHASAITLWVRDGLSEPVGRLIFCGELEIVDSAARQPSLQSRGDWGCIMSNCNWKRICFLSFLGFSSTCLSACGFLPGFGLMEQPALFQLTVAEVATRVACELQEFTAQHKGDPAYFGTPGETTYTGHKWVLSDDDVSVKLTLQTDESGYVNFTGVNVAQLGLASLQNFILSTTSGKTSVPSAAAKLSAKRTKTITIDFSVSARPLVSSDKVPMPSAEKTTAKTAKCVDWEKTDNFLASLYLKDWLNNYFETISFDDNNTPYHDATAPSETDKLLRTIRTDIHPASLPDQFKLTSVELTTTILLAVDLSAGATPNVLGNGSIFIVPVNGLSLDYNPDYSHKIDITLTMCDNSNLKKPCHQMDEVPISVAWNPLTDTVTVPSKTDPPVIFTLYQRRLQCEEYGKLNAILTGVKPPKTVEIFRSGSTRIYDVWNCGIDGRYAITKPNVSLSQNKAYTAQH